MKINIRVGADLYVRLQAFPNSDEVSAEFYGSLNDPNVFYKHSIELGILSKIPQFIAYDLITARFPNGIDLDYNGFLLMFFEHANNMSFGLINGAEHWAEMARKEFHASRERIYITLVERDGAFCRMCGSESDLTIDHDIPVTAGGTNELENLSILCRSCNSRKSNRPELRVIND